MKKVLIKKGGEGRETTGDYWKTREKEGAEVQEKTKREGGGEPGRRQKREREGRVRPRRE